MAEGKRKLAAILSADVAGYSRLMGDDEAATVRTLTDYREVFRDHIARHHGRVVDMPGDNLMAEFASPVEAVEAAAEIQRDLARRNRQLAEHRRMDFRIGINLGDVLEKDGALFGDGVNIAARLENLAEPGGICVSESAHMQVESKLDAVFESIGEHAVKNIAKPVKAYRLVAQGAAPRPRSRRPLAWAAAAALVFVIAGVAVWQTTQPPPSPPETVAAPEDPILALPTGPSIAVLAFDNLSGDPEQEYFSDGLTEEIITELSRFRDLFVIARNSTFQYKGQAVDIRQVGADLGVQYVVEGSVRKAGSTIRVSAQLLDATTGAHLWADDYDRELTAANIFSVQDAITQQIVSTIADPIGGIISLARFDDVKGKNIENLDAYECVLRANEYARALSPDVHFEVRSCLEKAVKNNPEYANAWGFLSVLYTDEFAFGFNPRPDSLGRALDAGRRAVQLEPRNALAHFQLARTHYLRDEVDRFFTEAEQAIALNPNNATVVASAGSFIAFAGKWERGIALLEKAMVLNPSHPGWYWIGIFCNQYRLGNNEQALAAAQKVNSRGWFWNHAVLAMSFAMLDRLDEAQGAIAELLKLYPDFAAKAYFESRKWINDQEHVEHMIDGLRKAGLDIPDERVPAE